MAAANSQGTKRPLVENSSFAKKKKLDLNFLHERFIDGKFSDFTVKAFGREWKLHKVILSGSPYFVSLFEKGWKDSQDQVVQLQIPDQKVTAEAVDACFRSLYAYEVEFDDSNVIQILAAASFFQLDELIQKSHSFMVESMDEDTVMDYYNASTTYGGGKTVENATLAFLKNWVTTISFVDQLPKISSELMVKIVGSSDAFCLGEGSLYITLAKWLYLKVTGSTFEENEDEEDQDRIDQAFDYFGQLECSTPFLLTKDGKPYVETFRQIRIRDMLSSKLYSISGLRKDKIFPEDWLREAAVQNWDRIVRGDGADEVSDINEQNFDEICSREGIKIEEFANTSEELRCVSTGIELSCEKSGINRVFKIKRPSQLLSRETCIGYRECISRYENGTKKFTSSIFHFTSSVDWGVPGDLEGKAKEKRDFWVRINLVVNEYNGRIKFSTSSGIKKVSLKIGETYQVLQIGEEYDDCEFSIGINYYVV